MFRLGIKEYFRNFWFNFFTVVILAVMIISSTILISTLTIQTKTYRYAKGYIGKNGEFISFAKEKYINELKDVDKIMAISEISIECFDNIHSVLSTSIYNERMQKYMKPILSEGRWVEESNDSGVLHGVISDNPYGIKTGDTINAAIVTPDGEKNIKIHICGKIMEGQKLCVTGGKLNTDMSINDLFTVYSYEQLQVVKLITTQSQIKNSGIKPDIGYSNVIVKYKDNISKDSMYYNQDVVMENGLDASNGYDLAFDKEVSLKRMKKLSDREEKNIYAKYIPLISVDFILICLCIMGMSAVKTARSSKYYGKLFICGMKWSGGTVLTIIEMSINSVLAMILGIVMLIIHNEYMLFGKIFANISFIQVIIMMCMCILTIIASAIMAANVMRDNTPIDILREN